VPAPEYPRRREPFEPPPRGRRGDAGAKGEIGGGKPGIGEKLAEDAAVGIVDLHDIFVLLGFSE
jgi:hypothetical protein